jgi:hypothetical protein
MSEKPQKGGSSKGEGGSWIYGLLLIIAGAFIVITGIMNVMGWNPLGVILGGIDPELALLASTTGWMSIIIGAWGFIGGIGLIKDQEWGWGISLVVLSVVIVTYLIDFITILSAMPAIMPSIIQWIEIGAVVVSAIGIVYLLLTKYKYA